MEFSTRSWTQQFKIPKTIAREDQVDYCLEIVEKYRAEAILMRKQVLQLKQTQKQVKIQKEELKKLKELIKQKDLLIRDLEEGHQELGELIEKYKTQRDMYREMIFKKNGVSKDEEEEKSSKKLRRGAQEGHKGYGRKKPEPDKHKRAYATHCPDCHKKINRTNTYTSHTIEDIPELLKLHTIVTEYQIERQWCGGCKKHIQAVPPEVIPNSRLGINLIMTGFLLKYEARTPINRVVSLYKNLFGIDLTEGGFDNMLKRAKDWLGEGYEEIRKGVQTSRVKHADETTWRIEGENHWLWGFMNKKSIYYKVEETRGKSVAEKELKNSHENDVLVRDDYPGYKKLPLKHQSCWAHLLRKSHEAKRAENASEEVKRLHGELKQLYQILSKTVKEQFKSEKRKKVYKESWSSLKGVIKSSYENKDTQKIQTRIANQGENLLTAVVHKNVPLTNNHAERQIRHMVTMRKISGGSKTMEGAKTHAVNMSVLQTIKLQDKPLVPTLKSYLLKGARNS
jgi:transposase